MDHLPVSVDPESDNSQSNLSDVATETFGNTALKFIDEYTRQKKRHRELFENLFKKYENMEVSGLKIRLEDIPDIRKEKRRKTKGNKKKSCSVKKVTDTRIKHKGNSEAHGMTEWQAEMESESDSTTDVLEIQDISTVCSNSDTLPRQYFLEQQMKRFGAFMQDELIACNNFQQSEREIEEKQPKERCKESKRKRLPFRKESFTTQLVKKKGKSAEITEADEISGVSTAGFNSAQKKNKPASISKGHETSDLSVGSINSVKKKSKSADITEEAETSDLSTVGFNSAQRTRKPASISKGHETSELSVARINLVKKKSKSANITEVAETSDLSTVGFNSAQRTRKPASISKVHETSELSVARINLVKKKSKSANITEVAETSDLSTVGFNSAQRTRKPASISKVHETSELSVARINLVKKKSKSANITEVAETSDLSTVGFNSAQRTRKPASISKVHETSELSVARINLELNMGNENWNEEHPMGPEYDNEVVKETKSKEGSLIPYVVLENYRKNQIKKKSKSADITEADEISGVSTAGFNSAQKKNKPASISKGHETSDLSVGSINSVKKKSKSANITEVAETSDLSTVGFNSAQRTRKPASISKGNETSELSVARINLVKKKSKSANITEVAETSDISTVGFNSAQRKRKPASISKGHETSELSVARINLELNMGNENWNEEHPMGLEYDNEVVKETKSKEGSLIPYVVLENYRKNQKLNMGNENWNEEHPMGLEYDNEVVKETKSKEGSLIPYVVLENCRKNQKLNVDNSSCKEDVFGNQSLKKSRFKKGHVLFADHVTKSSSRKSVISNTGENFKCVNDVAKVSANALAKSWKSEGFKKHLWHGIVPVCSLSRSPQTSSRSTLGFAPVSAMSPVPRLLRPLSPQTC